MGMTIPDPYARTTFHGKPLDNATVEALKVIEAELGYELTILQGIGGAAASAGTHTEGRAVDLAAWDHPRKVRALRDFGFAAWHRPTLPGVWGEHIHAVLIFEDRSNSRGLADVGFRQIASYDAGRNGLADNAIDPNPYRPSPKRVFTLDEYRARFEAPVERPVRTKVSRARSRLVESIAALSQAAALLDDADPKRVKARSYIDDLLTEKAALEAVLTALPER